MIRITPKVKALGYNRHINKRGHVVKLLFLILLVLTVPIVAENYNQHVRQLQCEQ